MVTKFGWCKRNHFFHHRLQLAHAAFFNLNILTLWRNSVEGFVMDKFCVDLGTLLDKPDLISLQYPGEHSLHWYDFDLLA